MAEPIATEYVAIRPDTKGFKSDVSKTVDPVVADLNKKLKALAIGAAVGSFIKGGIAELKQQENVAAQTQARLKATGDAANVTAKQVSDLAEAEQALSGTDKEVVQEGANLLLTFKSIRNEVGAGNNIFDQALHAANDLAHAGFGDLTTTSVQLGKALEDPITGLTALRRVGVTFSAQQRDQIKTLTETGNLLEAQKVLLKAVEDQVGGAAEAYGTTLGGKLERAQNALDDFKANIVGSAAPALEQLAKVAVVVGDGFGAIPVPLQTLVVGLAAVAIAAKPVKAGIEAGKVAIDLFHKSVATTTRVLGDGGAAVQLYGTNVGIMAGQAAGVVGLALALNQLVEASSAGKFGTTDVDRFGVAIDHLAASGNFEGALGNLNDLKDAIHRLNDDAAESPGPLSGLGDGVRDLTQGTTEEAKKKIQALDEALTSLAKSDPAAAASAYKQLLSGLNLSAADGSRIFDDYAGAVEDSGIAASDAKGPTDDLSDSQDKQKQTTDDLFTASTQLIDAQQNQAAAAKGISDAQRGITDAQADGVQAARDIRSAQLDLIDAQRELADIQRRGAADQRDIAGAQLDARGAILDVADAQDELNKVLADPEATARDRERAQLALERAQLRVADSTDDVGEAQRKAAGRGEELERAQGRVKDAQQGIIDAQQAQKDATDKQIEAVDKLAAAYENQAINAVALAGIQATLAGGQLDGTEKANIFRASLQGVADTLDPNSDLYKRLIGFIDALGAIPITAARQLINDKARPGVINAEQRAAGGPVSGFAQIAERGPEEFEDSKGNHFLVGTGQVTPLKRQGLAARTSSARPATVVQITQNLYGTDPRVTADKATAAAKRATFLHGVST